MWKPHSSQRSNGLHSATTIISTVAQCGNYPQGLAPLGFSHRNAPPAGLSAEGRARRRGRAGGRCGRCGRGGLVPRPSLRSCRPSFRSGPPAIPPSPDKQKHHVPLALVRYLVAIRRGRGAPTAERAVTLRLPPTRGARRHSGQNLRSPEPRLATSAATTTPGHGVGKTAQQTESAAAPVRFRSSPLLGFRALLAGYSPDI